MPQVMPSAVLYDIIAATGFEHTATVFNTQPHGSFKTSVMVSFTCGHCRRRWYSGKVEAELVWLKRDKQFYTVVYGQQCSRCDAEFELAQFDEDERARITELFIDILLSSGRKAPAPAQERFETKGPHLSEFCEACAMGCCSLASDNHECASYEAAPEYQSVVPQCPVRVKAPECQSAKAKVPKHQCAKHQCPKQQCANSPLTTTTSTTHTTIMAESPTGKVLLNVIVCCKTTRRLQ
eukprot:TRINITY_DN993_c0_g1_i2.p1 TRINITY_DN993_c0_g1~~TRINITY_DN993_c0_g1_i2.p1  ORF type:complete len:237 (-),score=54.12 TRINITY_DN993_c0_g1_i2:45-755(-)